MNKYYTTARMVLVALMVCVGSALAAPSSQPAAATTSPADQGSGVGSVKGDNVYVRSGFSRNYYPVVKLKAGDKVSILRNQFGWYEIQPPAGAYSLVEKARINKTGEGVGEANDVAQVYAGSDLNPKDRYAKQVKLSKGESVKILGETAEGDFYKVAPPEGATLWIRADMVNRGDKIASNAGKIEVIKPGDLPKSAEENKTVAAAPVKKQTTSATPTQRPQPDAGQIRNEPIRAIEAEIAAESIKPEADRKYGVIIAKLRPLAESSDIVTQTWAKARMESLANQIELIAALDEIKAVKSKAIVEADEIARRRARLQAERGIWDVNPVVARGEIRPSSVYTGAGGQARRWRLVDPKSDRTVAYIEVPADSSLDPVQFYGKFVGVEAISHQLLHGTVPPLPVYTVRNIQVMDPNAPLEHIIRRGAYASPASPSTQPAKERPAASQPALESSPRPETIIEKPVANQPTLKSSAHP